MTAPQITKPRPGSAALPPARQWRWQDEGNCADADVNTFFDADSHAVSVAKRICASCPLAVRRACLDHAITTPEKYGVWGGFSQEERKTERLRRQRGYPARYEPPLTAVFVPREPVASEMTARRARELFAEGLSMAQIAREADVEAKTVRRLVGPSPQRVVTRETERKIAAAHARLLSPEHTSAA